MICPKTDFEKDLISYLKKNVINFSSEEISNIYSFWKKQFDKLPAELSTEVKIISEKCSISENQYLPKESYLLGIDFPTWFNTPEDKEFKIMVLGIDPLRNEKAFKCMKADVDNEVIIGTPYALHMSNMRAGRTKQYWNFINLLSENNFVYLTDIYKTFFYTDKSKKERSYNYYKNNLLHSQKDLLEEEIKLINPDLIITFGAETYFQLMDKRAPKLTSYVESNIIEFMGKPVLPMIHLSGSVRQQTKINFLKENKINVIDKNFGQAYFQIINKYLGKIKR